MSKLRKLVRKSVGLPGGKTLIRMAKTAEVTLVERVQMQVKSTPKIRAQVRASVGLKPFGAFGSGLSKGHKRGEKNEQMRQRLVKRSEAEGRQWRSVRAPAPTASNRTPKIRMIARASTGLEVDQATSDQGGVDLNSMSQRQILQYIESAVTESLQALIREGNQAGDFEVELYRFVAGAARKELGQRGELGDGEAEFVEVSFGPGNRRTCETIRSIARRTTR